MYIKLLLGADNGNNLQPSVLCLKNMKAFAQKYALYLLLFPIQLKQKSCESKFLSMGILHFRLVSKLPTIKIQNVCIKNHCIYCKLGNSLKINNLNRSQ